MEHFLLTIFVILINFFEQYFTNLRTAYLDFSGSAVGGNLIESFKVVEGLNTLPAILAFGNPSAPITET